MNDSSKLLRLASALVERDESRECPFCDKQDWGEDKHASSCPFAIAYEILNDQENKPDEQ